MKTINRLAAACDVKRPDLSSYKPALFRGDDHAELSRLAELVEGPQVTAVHDALASQLTELAETRSPERKLSREELEAFAQRELAGRPADEYGVWVYYPWSRRVVHVLPESEYRELRTSRNRNKITAEEQTVLRGLRLGIVGLSVGQATAVTLALEEIGGTYLLADFDRLELSNMNRLRAGVHSIGVNKALLTAREIYEINPYARVEVFSDGIDESNIETFLVGERKLDILFEECDDLEMKIRLRERAREYGIPVLMETSDRGMIDVERFDLDRSRPLLHGLVGDVRANSLKGLTTYEKVPIVLRIIGAETMSGRLAASLLDIETTLKTWPQLASNVTLGGALNADVARRVALGQFTGSGRYYVDLESAINDSVDGSVRVEAEADAVSGASPEDVALPQLRSFAGELTETQVRDLVKYAISAPSGGNCQPWRFVYRRERFDCYFDRERSKTYLDFDNTASYLAIGAAVENLCLAARQLGLDTELDTFPSPEHPDLVCSVRLTRASTNRPAHDDLAAHIGARVTNRKLGP
ncbi:MAG TPA: Rv1355c family protein, partial [Polyangiaceae bacterium]|nr:Rv1355c family protein [Polyangiaceae bacterium]